MSRKRSDKERFFFELMTSDSNLKASDFVADTHDGDGCLILEPRCLIRTVGNILLLANKMPTVDWMT